MKLWVVCFIILFGSFELYQWIGQFSWFSDAQVSLPLTVAGGIFLAIASNYDRISGLPFNPLSDRTPQSNPLSPPQPAPTAPPKALNQATKRPLSFQILSATKRSISFEIPRRRDREADN
ncbi:MAG: hypothetical protein QNJ46_04795 [Leptolyngbyaceae cyanobacterium MO_188.B28]|nr:hypothetical protein [Leptolyngbyaceae cyanobacterium MO_188.B28]